MATITVEDVRDRCPTSLSDSVIEDYICTVNALVGDCLDSTYPDCVAKTIQANLVCHLIYLADNPQRVSGYKTPNSTSESYEVYTSEDGLGSTSFGKTILLLDKNGCVQQGTSTPFWLQSVGSTNPPRYRG